MGKWTFFKKTFFVLFFLCISSFSSFASSISDYLDKILFSDLQLQAVTVDMYLYLGWFPEEKEGMREASQKANPKPKEGTIISTSTKEGFSWSCEASGELIVKHTAKTIETAFISLNKNGDSELDKLMLAIAIMEEMSKVAKSEGVK